MISASESVWSPAYVARSGLLRPRWRASLGQLLRRGRGCPVRPLPILSLGSPFVALCLAPVAGLGLNVLGRPLPPPTRSDAATLPPFLGVLPSALVSSSPWLRHYLASGTRSIRAPIRSGSDLSARRNRRHSRLAWPCRIRSWMSHVAPGQRGILQGFHSVDGAP